jgi:hypothetical protein
MIYMLLRPGSLLRNKVYHWQKRVEIVNQAMMLDLPLACLAAESELTCYSKMSRLTG